MGAQDSLEQAEDFVGEYGTVSLQMLWDPGFDSWSQLGIRGQPAFAIFDGNGLFQTGWYGGANPEDVLDIVASL
jgi:hypothetical protein